MSSKQHLQNRKEMVNPITVWFWGQKRETVPRNNSRRQQLGQFHLATLSKEDETQLGCLDGASHPVSCKAKWQYQRYGHCP